MNFALKNAAPADLDDLERLEAATLRPPWSRDGLKAALEDEKYLVLVARAENGEAAGFLVAFNVGDEAEIARLGVAADFRRQGLARKLLEAARQILDARGVAQIFLELRAQNEAARRLYHSLGFEQVGRRADYYGDGEDAILMRTDGF